MTADDSKAGARILPSRVPIDPDIEGADVVGDAREAFADREKPVFVLLSDSDPVTRSARGDLLSVFPTADEQPETWIQGGGHFLQEDRGEAVADWIVDFVDRTEATDSRTGRAAVPTYKASRAEYPNMHSAERVTLARLPSGVEVTTTVHTYGGDGPTVYLQAAQHGREVNGTEVLRRVHDRLVDADLAGRVVAVPVANPLTFDRVSYTTPEELDSAHSNMNRVWPGDPAGTLHERMAAGLWAYAVDADAAVDLHTGSPDMHTHVVFMDGDEDARALAEAFDTDLLLAEPAGDDASAEWNRRNFAGKFRVAATRESVPTITPELAHNKQIVEPAVEAGVSGVLNVLRHLGVLPDEPASGGDRTVARNHLGRVDAADAGLFRPHPGRRLGERVTAGTPLGTLYDPGTYEVLQEATADDDGILYALTREGTVVGGDKLANVAIPK